MKRARIVHIGVAIATALCIAPILPAATAAPDGPRKNSDATIAVAPSSTDVFKRWTSSTDGGTRVAISTDGNLIQFRSPNSAGNQYEHIGVAALSEGYVLCYTDPSTSSTVNAFDTGSSEDAFGASRGTLSPVSVTRETSDGALRLQQVFTFDGPGKSLQMIMSVKNLTGSSIDNITLRRQVDFDIDGGGASGWSDLSNNFAVTSDSVFAWNDPSAAPAGRTAHGMVLRHTKGPETFAHVAKVTGDILDSSCDASSAVPTPVLGEDDGGTLQYSFGTLAAGERKKVTVEYVRI